MVAVKTAAWCCLVVASVSMSLCLSVSIQPRSLYHFNTSRMSTSSRSVAAPPPSISLMPRHEIPNYSSLLMRGKGHTRHNQMEEAATSISHETTTLSHIQTLNSRPPESLVMISSCTGSRQFKFQPIKRIFEQSRPSFCYLIGLQFLLAKMFACWE